MVQKQERYALNDSETLQEVVSCLTEYIPVPTQGNCTQQTIFEILIRALRVRQSPTEGNHTVGAGLTASQRDSIENTSKTLNNSPTSNDIRYHLEKYDNLDTLECQLNKALQSRLPSRIYQGQPQVAMKITKVFDLLKVLTLGNVVVSLWLPYVVERPPRQSTKPEVKRSKPNGLAVFPILKVAEHG